jgi:hypothetical protein
MSSRVITKSFLATAVAIAPYLIAKHSAANGTIEVASANTDLLIGAVDSLGVEASTLADFDFAGVREVRAGGVIAAGDPLTSDANGKAIKALPANSTQVRIIGFALAAAAADDIIPYSIAPGCLSKASA